MDTHQELEELEKDIMDFNISEFLRTFIIDLEVKKMRYFPF